MKIFSLTAKISTDKPKAIKPVLKELLPEGNISFKGNEFVVSATLSGENAKELNRNLLSALRRAERKTRLRSEWKTGKTIERFFDYVQKGVKKK